MNTDLGPKNILFSPRNIPSRAVVIDFREAELRKGDQGDEQWKKIEHLIGEVYEFDSNVGETLWGCVFWYICFFFIQFFLSSRRTYCADLSDLVLPYA